MALIPIPGFCGSSYLSRARGVSASRTVNLFVERNQDPTGTPYQPIPVAKSPFTMFPRSGKKLFAHMPIGPSVGMWSNIDRVFVASGGNVYELLEDGTSTLLGAIQVGSNPVTFRSNGRHLLTCSGGSVYVHTGTQFYRPIVNYASGNVSVAGTAVTWLAGDQFTGTGGDILPGDLFMIDGDLRIVDTVADATHLTLTTPAGASANASYQVGKEFVSGAMCEFIDGYFIVNIPNTRQFRISNLDDGTKWDALDVAAKSGSTDSIAAITNISGNLALIGDNASTEIWGDSGNADFPFARINGSTISIGTDAAWSVGKLTDGSIAFLLRCEGGAGMLVKSAGGQPQRISNYAFENAIRKYAKTNDAISSTYLENGHSHYRIDFPTANRTWDYDDNTGTLVEIGIETDEDEVYGADLGRYHVHVTWPNGKTMHLAADYSSDKIFEVSPDFLDDDGVDFPVMRISPHINSNLEWSSVSKFALDCELGTVDPTLMGPDGKPLIPTVSMSYSDDGGRTWQDAGAASLGRAGEWDGTFLDAAESFDNSANSQTNPQVFEAVPVWSQLGAFWISKTFKIKSTGKMLRAVYNGLVELDQPGSNQPRSSG